jgi:hypothetical protein
MATHLPVGFIERAARIEHIILTCRIPSHSRTALTLTRVTRVVPYAVGSGPVTTEGGVENVKVVIEVGVRGAAIRGEVGHRGPPRGGVGVVILDICGDSISGEEPDRDTGFIPFHCE